MLRPGGLRFVKAVMDSRVTQRFVPFRQVLAVTVSNVAASRVMVTLVEVGSVTARQLRRVELVFVLSCSVDVCFGKAVELCHVPLSRGLLCCSVVRNGSKGLLWLVALSYVSASFGVLGCGSLGMDQCV